MRESDPRVLINLKEIRTEAGLSLSQVAKLTGVSKAMLGQIERGESSPTVATLWKVARGLHVPFSVLIEDTLQESDRVMKAPLAPALLDGGVKYSTIHPYDPMFGSETFLVTLEPGQTYISVPHDVGIVEDIFVARGRIEVLFDEHWHALGYADSLRFRADREHGYRNLAGELAQFCATMHYPKTPV